jgi:uncharacterized circularly permuted ATP-grasp superfamily protein
LSRSTAPAPLFEGYERLAACYDELFDDRGEMRRGKRRAGKLLDELGRREFARRQRLADETFMKGGITFSVYADQRGTEKIFPFDLIPRIVTARAWRRVELGLEQRVRALNLFLSDVYGRRLIFREHPLLEELALGSDGYRPQMQGFEPPHGSWVNIAGIDLVRRPDGAFVVLEDNLRVPSGVSYVLENRRVLKRALPGVFHRARVRSVSDYPVRLRETLASLAGGVAGNTEIALLTPGAHNSAYFEHSFLARRMGVPLVEGRDLFVRRRRLWVRTTDGPRSVRVLYRRIDDDFLDPTVFRKDSLLGVAGLVDACRAGNLVLANCIGNGLADDKAVYAFVPEIVRFYLGEKPILEQVPTYLCRRPDDLSYVLDHLEELVVKEVSGSGGYGMTVGPTASRRQLSEARAAISAQPEGFIAQPVVELSACPSWTGREVGARRVDLRPYVLTGDRSWVLPGGLTRVALRKGSFVVNSSQGGGSKDTWVMRGRGGDEGRP